MTTSTFHYESLIHAIPRDVFAFHARPDALSRLIPPWENTRLLTPDVALRPGAEVRLKTRIGPFWFTMVAEIIAVKTDEYFEDRLVRGPFTEWRHRHVFLPAENSCTLLRDEISYTPPLGILGRLADPLVIRPRLRKLFAWRHAVTAREIYRSMPVAAGP